MASSEMAASFFKYASISVALAMGLYATLLGLWTTSTFQSHVVVTFVVRQVLAMEMHVRDGSL
jgi:abhydrolase domain-containing protein 12